ncbi:hypothetical protein [Acinetobacter lanii]|uniref:Uncharacterized protein n=1 Tax=Acinetobacter lanii TaxID=2715163 RepID=A0A6G8S0E0_9GAMM|nr:hypothetical protein [Acinetobacter lanii]QIO07575.1 hypothetical protein G8D99_00065 [Acinetobacter lanii]
MNNKTTIPLSIYYALIILQFILPFIAGGIDMLSNHPELKLLDETLYIEPQMWEISVMLIVGMILLIIVIGLLLRKEWARKAYLFTIIPSFLIYFMPYMQWFYMTSSAALFNDLAYICSGMLLMILIMPQLYKPLFNDQK